jgi:RNA polymerase sigma factor for flagellar operon FliA
MNPGESHNIHSLWKEYGATRSLEIRRRLIENYLPFLYEIARFVAMKLPRRIRVETIVSHGTLGLIEAVEGFDPQRGVLFETYAKSRIRGAIFDELRREDWLPWRLRRKKKWLEHTMGELVIRLGRDPTTEELAAELGLDPEKIVAIQGKIAQIPEFISLDYDISNLPTRGIKDERIVGPLGWVLREEDSRMVLAALERLSRMERIVIWSYYFEELTMQAIGGMLSLSEGRICQIHHQALEHLRRCYRYGVTKK